MSAEAPLESYLAGQWSRGQGIELELIDPTNGTPLATVSARGLDLDGALKFARQKGGPALRALDLCRACEDARCDRGCAGSKPRAL